MRTLAKRRLIGCMLWLSILMCFMTTTGYAEEDDHAIMVKVVSKAQVEAMMGDKENFTIVVKNTSDLPIDSLKAYMVLLDTKKEMIMDLEEFEADQFMTLDSLAPGESVELNMGIKYFLASDYYLYVAILNTDTGDVTSSPTIRVMVNQKTTMTTDMVQNVALIEPIVLAALVVLMTLKRKRRIMAYS